MTSSKARKTAENIVEKALRLFASQGFEATTMKQIAEAAGCSTGLAYRYFRRKEDLALALYLRLARELATAARAVDAGTMGERFVAVMRLKLALVDPHREALAALGGAMLRDGSPLDVLGDETVAVRAEVQCAIVAAVSRAENAPRPWTEELGALLYTTHLTLLLVWLLDHDPARPRTEKALRAAGLAIDAAAPWLAHPAARAFGSTLQTIINPQPEEMP
ncbi:MAG: TetR/AcrR family transcriptional regulator [Myxococcales bacterium]|nr:TetR/AcrR family transcriptional regulator [Myxococcales bacterium]